MAFRLCESEEEMGNLVDYETDRGIAIITLRDPPVNSFTHEMLSELDSYVLDAL
ncbi:MAG TPA: hypothetical protein PLD50_08145 [Polyangiaceae bacterium]|nr:hypothetical protein [Polyangiaceae bacterium]